MTSHLAVLPVINPDAADRCLASMVAPGSSLGLLGCEVLIVDNTRYGYCPQLEHLRNRLVGASLGGAPVPAEHRLRLHRDPGGHNLGVAGSWNVGARKVLDEQLDWLTIVSTSMLFGPELHTTWRREVEAHPDAQIVECMGNSWHLIAIARRTLETVGLFDENYYPAYEEAIDWGYRQKLLGWEQLGWPRVWCNAMSVGAALNVKPEVFSDAPSCPAQPLLDYYARKWGGPKGGERYVHPFNDPSRGLDSWDVRSIPEMAKDYGLEVWW